MTPPPKRPLTALAVALAWFALVSGAAAQVRYVISPIDPTGIAAVDVFNTAIGSGGVPYEQVDRPAIGGNFVAALFENDQAAEDLRLARPDLIVEPDREVEPAAGPVAGAWSPDRIDQRFFPLDAAYLPPMLEPCGDHRPFIYICDTGIFSSHDEFTTAGDRVRFVGSYIPVALTSGIAPLRTVGAFQDPWDHGTAVTGCAIGQTTGAGRCPADIVSAACYPDPGALGGGGGTFASYAADVIYWSLNEHSIRANDNDPLNDASILVFASTTQGGPSMLLDLAVQRARLAGMTVIVAAGNQGVDAVGHSPAGAAALPHGDITLTVAASDITDTRWIGPAGASNYGPLVELFAPGDNVPGASGLAPNLCTLRSGTSLSAGYVAGAAARILHVNPRAKAAEVGTLLTDQTDPVYGPSGPFPGIPPGVGGINAVPKLLYINPNTVPCVPLPFGAWCDEHRLQNSGMNGGVPGDPLVDCASAVLDYLMGLEPGESGKQWPKVKITDTHLEYRFPLANYVCAPVAFAVEISADCFDWTPLPPDAIVEDASAACIDGAKVMLVQIPLGPPEIFLRLRVEGL